MGGPVGLKGTDGVAAEAVQRGAKPVANARALAMLQEFRRALDETLHQPAIKWLTADGDMGNDALRTAGFDAIKVVHRGPGESSAFDTKTAVEKFLVAGVDLVLFCGGDVPHAISALSRARPRPSSVSRPASKCIPAYSASHPHTLPKYCCATLSAR